MNLKQTRISTGGAGNVVNHVLKQDENELVRVIEGDANDILVDAELDAHVMGRSKSVRHIVISPSENLTDEQRDQIIDEIRAEFGAGDRPAFVVEHVKERANGSKAHHFHVLMPETFGSGPQLDSKHFKVRNEKIARKMEVAFGHEVTKGRHNKAVHLALLAEGNIIAADAVEALTADGPSLSKFGDKAHQKAKRQDINLPQISQALKDLRGASATEIAEGLQQLERQHDIQINRGDTRNIIAIRNADGEVLHNANRSLKIRAKDVGAILETFNKIKENEHGSERPGSTDELERADVRDRADTASRDRTAGADNVIDTRADAATDASHASGDPHVDRRPDAVSDEERHARDQDRYRDDHRAPGAGPESGGSSERDTRADRIEARQDAEAARSVDEQISSALDEYDYSEAALYARERVADPEPYADLVAKLREDLDLSDAQDVDNNFDVEIELVDRFDNFDVEAAHLASVDREINRDSYADLAARLKADLVNLEAEPAPSVDEQRQDLEAQRELLVKQFERADFDLAADLSEAIQTIDVQLNELTPAEPDIDDQIADLVAQSRQLEIDIFETDDLDSISQIHAQLAEIEQQINELRQDQEERIIKEIKDEREAATDADDRRDRDTAKHDVAEPAAPGRQQSGTSEGADRDEKAGERTEQNRDSSSTVSASDHAVAVKSTEQTLNAAASQARNQTRNLAQGPVGGGGGSKAPASVAPEAPPDMSAPDAAERALQAWSRSMAKMNKLKEETDAAMRSVSVPSGPAPKPFR